MRMQGNKCRIKQRSLDNSENQIYVEPVSTATPVAAMTHTKVNRK